jgi:hypothetical protein
MVLAFTTQSLEILFCFFFFWWGGFFSFNHYLLLIWLRTWQQSQWIFPYGKGGDVTQLGACQLIPDQEGNWGQGPGREKGQRGCPKWRSRREVSPAQVTGMRLHLLSATSSLARARLLRCSKNSKTAAWGNSWTSIILCHMKKAGPAQQDLAGAHTERGTFPPHSIPSPPSHSLPCPMDLQIPGPLKQTFEGIATNF